MMPTRHILMLGAVASSVFLLSGCAAVGTAVAHGSLETQTRMSKTVFLDPVPNRDKTIYLQVRNTSDKQGFRIRHALRDALEDKGYRVIPNFNRAYYVLQINILKVGKMSQTAAERMMGQGYGGTLEGAFTGAAIASATGNNPVAGGIIGGVATTIIDNAVKDVNFTAVTDVRIKVRSHPRHTHRTRIVSTANQVNLQFSTAMPSLENGLVNSISGIF